MITDNIYINDDKQLMEALLDADCHVRGLSEETIDKMCKTLVMRLGEMHNCEIDLPKHTVARMTQIESVAYDMLDYACDSLRVDLMTATRNFKLGLSYDEIESRADLDAYARTTLHKFARLPRGRFDA